MREIEAFILTTWSPQLGRVAAALQEDAFSVKDPRAISAPQRPLEGWASPEAQRPGPTFKRRGPWIKT